MSALPDTVEGLKKLLVDKVKQYESKLAALNAINSALQKENEKIKKDLAKAGSLGDNDAEEELEELKEEFRQRLGAAERQVETLKDEKAALRAKLSEATAGGQSSEHRISDLEASIQILKEEGDALSRKNGELEAASRKLRSSNRELETERDKLSARVKLLEGQLLETQERADHAAQEASTQIEQLEGEVEQIRLDMRKQLAEAQRQFEEAVMRTEELSAKGGEALLSAAREREATLMANLSEARAMLEDGAEEWASKEENFRRQMNRLEERIRQLEVEREDAAAAATDATAADEEEDDGGDGRGGGGGDENGVRLSSSSTSASVYDASSTCSMDLDCQTWLNHTWEESVMMIKDHRFPSILASSVPMGAARVKKMKARTGTANDLDMYVPELDPVDLARQSAVCGRLCTWLLAVEAEAWARHCVTAAETWTWPEEASYMLFLPHSAFAEG